LEAAFLGHKEHDVIELNLLITFSLTTALVADNALSSTITYLVRVHRYKVL
jgi:hypothetical protein